jgi:hypothetical protein
MASPDEITSDDIAVVRDDDRQRYEAKLDGEVVGHTRFQTRPGTVVFIHTEVEPAYEGRGVGSELARAALDDVRRRGENVVPRCPFIADYIKRHPDYADLVVDPAG